MRIAARAAGGKAGLIALMLVGPASPASAAPPVGIVETVEGPVGDLAPLDYLVQGETLVVPAGGRVVLNYFAACTHETITGAATVVVGADHSVAPEASVVRRTLPCDAGAMTVSPDESQLAAGFVDRGVGRPAPGLHRTPQAQVILYGASPLILAPLGAAIAVDRLGGVVTHDVLETETRRGASFYDYAGHGRALVPGALYRATSGGRAIVFRVSPDAAPGATPLIGRLLVF